MLDYDQIKMLLRSSIENFQYWIQATFEYKQKQVYMQGFWLCSYIKVIVYDQHMLQFTSLQRILLTFKYFVKWNLINK